MNKALLPHDIQDTAHVRQCLAETEKRLAEAYQTIADKDQIIQAKVQMIDKLESIIADLVRRKWGRSSEKHPGQMELSLFNETELAALKEPVCEQAEVDAANDPQEGTPEQPAQPGTDANNHDAPEAANSEVASAVKKRRSRRLPDTLPRVKVTYEMDSDNHTCPNHGQWVVVGEEVSEQLGIIPARQFVIQHVKVKYACSCKHCGVQSADMPTQPIPGSQASPSVLAYTAVSKYEHGLPLYRQEAMWQQQSLDLPRAKLARWLMATGQLLQPLHNLMQDVFYDYDIAQADETGIQVLKEDGRLPSTKSALWIRRGGAPQTPVVLLDYHTSKGSAVANDLLGAFKGYLVVDAAACYENIVAKNQLKRVLCNDHARRRFVKAALRAPKSGTKTTLPQPWVATKAIAFYKKLYKIEAQIKDLPPDQRYQQRQTQSVPVWQVMMDWAKDVHSAGVRHTKTREALNYLINHEADLRRYCDDGRLPISNIKSEQVAKTIAVCRKNFMFADTPAGAQTSALLFGVIQSAKANAHNAFYYLSAVLAKLPQATSLEHIEALLPWRLKPDEAEAIYRCQPAPSLEKIKCLSG